MTIAEKEIPGTPPRRSAKKTFLLMALIVILLSGIGIYANVWKESRIVGEVVVEGNHIVPAGDILTLAAVPKSSPMFQLDLFALEQRVMKNQYVRSVAVHRDIPDRVRISIEERVPVAALVTNRLCYLDAEGVVLPPVRSSLIFDLPVLTGNWQDAEFATGKPTRNRNVLEALAILSLAKAVDEEAYRNISEIHFEGNKDIMFYTAEFGIPVLLGHDQIGSKLVLFDSFWKSVVAKNGGRGLQYIDLRFEDQVVVRWNHNDGDVHS